MSTSATSATQKQVEPTDQPASALKPEPIRSVHSIQESSAKVVEGEQRIPVTRIESRYAEGVDSSERAPRVWQLATIIIPVLLTGWLTFWSSQTESKIKRDIDDQSQMLSEQLDLTKDLYKRRFDAYERLFTELINLQEITRKDKVVKDQLVKDQLAIERQKTGSNSAHLSSQTKHRLALWNRQTADLLEKLAQLREVHGLHMSDDVAKLMEKAWLVGAREDPEKIALAISGVESQMRLELERQMVGQRQTQSVHGTTEKRESF